MLATIYTAYMFYLQLLTQHICFIYNYLHSICFIYNYLHSIYVLFTTTYTALILYFWASLVAQSVLKNPPPNIRDVGLIPGLGKSLGEGNSNLFQYSCLGNPRDREAWWATVHGVTKELDMT